ncbi:hypothetical protein MTR_7g055903 [Medicago truncatula]|uniref:Uncharacterized protein n=1 Tax=Medicago truncatula TaxID=3880 RepID=A0A072TYK9_MEDTR|nr:hypothetical protein MTR_7g055903 [Medicago truncatula]
MDWYGDIMEISQGQVLGVRGGAPWVHYGNGVCGTTSLAPSLVRGDSSSALLALKNPKVIPFRLRKCWHNRLHRGL